MSMLENVIRQLEDFVLIERDLFRTGRIPFEHQGNTEYGYPYIRSANSVFEAVLLATLGRLQKPPAEIRFLEVGSGLGTKCEIARLHGLQSSGVELNPGLVELARRIFWNCKFVHANALEFDYHEFDLVYYYVPFFEDVLLFQLEQRILSQLPINGILIATRLSDALQHAIGEQADGCAPLQRIRFGAELELGTLEVLQKISPIEMGTAFSGKAAD
jgi:SAM-dependent methyltransferase